MEEGAAVGSWEEGNNTTGTIWQDLVKLAIAQLVKNPPAMQETLVRFLGLGRSAGEGKGYLLQNSGLENSMDSTVQFSSVIPSCPTLCNLLNPSMPGLPVHY